MLEKHAFSERFCTETLRIGVKLVSGDCGLTPIDRMGAAPVTFAIWKEYCVATDIAVPEAPSWGILDDHPVVNVSWNDIMGTDGKGGFCAWASNISGFHLTLPTEAQWEYAARGGVAGQEFPWGNSFDDSKVWCSMTTERASTAPVVRPSNIYRNAYGLTDMVGNVWQWCSDLHTPYGTTLRTDPPRPSSTSVNNRCVRGGMWFIDDLVNFRTAVRGVFRPDLMNYGLGFRLSAEPG